MFKRAVLLAFRPYFPMRMFLHRPGP